METLQQFVTRKMREKNLTIRQVAQRAREQGHKISEGYINNILTGIATDPRVSSLHALAVGLGITKEEEDKEEIKLLSDKVH